MWLRSKKAIVAKFHARNIDEINRKLDDKGLDASDVISIIEKSSIYVVFYREKVDN